MSEDRVYLDHGLTGTHRERPVPDKALAQPGGFGARRLDITVGNATLFA